MFNDDERPITADDMRVPIFRTFCDNCKYYITGSSFNIYSYPDSTRVVCEICSLKIDLTKMKEGNVVFFDEIQKLHKDICELKTRMSVQREPKHLTEFREKKRIEMQSSEVFVPTHLKYPILKYWNIIRKFIGF